MGMPRTADGKCKERFEMLAAIPETAKKLSEKVIHSNKPVIFRLKDVQPFGVTTRDFTTFRRSIVFASSKPIVPEMAGGRGRAGRWARDARGWAFGGYGIVRFGASCGGGGTGFDVWETLGRVTLARTAS